MQGINETDSAKSGLEVSEIEGNKQIVSNLLSLFVQNSIVSFLNSTSNFVNTLNSDSSIIRRDESGIGVILYAVKFEAVNLTFADEVATIYLGFGLNLDMQKSHLGYWFKSPEENYYKFWHRVFQDIKASGVRKIHFNCSDNYYWISEALNNIFTETD